MSLAGRLQHLLDQKGVFYEIGKRAFIIDCLQPSCRKERHCYLWKSDGGAICFKCGQRMGWRRVVAAITHCDVRDAYSVLFGVGAGDRLGFELDPKLFDEKDPGEDEEELDASIQLGPDFVPVGWSDVGVGYLQKRGVTDATLICEYDLRYHGWMNAVVFPVKRDGVCYGWQARFIDPQTNQRMTSFSFNKARFLLNWDRAKSQSKVILVEGPFDCIAADIPGLVGAVASLGKGVSQDQIKLLLDSPIEEIYLGLDEDATSEVYDVLGRIGLSKKVFRIFPPKHREDFGASKKDEIAVQLAEAVRLEGPSSLLSVYFKE